MFIWIAFFFALLAGVLAGLYAGLLHCKNRKKRAEKPTQTNAQKEKKRRWTAKLTRLLHRSHKPKQENADLLQKKIAHNGVTLDEFNCAADGKDYQEYLQNMRQQENQAYKILAEK